MLVEQIKVQSGFNVRENGGGIEDLAQSIKLLGVLVPLIVDGQGRLIAGHRRLAAAKLAGLTEVPAVVRDTAGTGDASQSSQAAHAAENIVRQQLSPAEEAEAIRRMLEAGYTPSGAGQALAMSQSRVTRRLQLLDIPEVLRGLWGPDGTARTSSIPAVCDLVTHLPELAPAILKFHQVAWDGESAERGWTVDQFAQDPLRYLTSLERAMNPISGFAGEQIKGMPKVKDFIVAVTRTVLRPDGKLGSAKVQARHAELAELAGRSGSFDVRYLRVAEADVDMAVAAGAGLEIPGRDGPVRIVTSRKWLSGHMPTMLDAWEQTIKADAAAAKKTPAAKKGKKGEPAPALSPAEQATVDAREREREQEKEWKLAARGANLDLGAGLLKGLSDVEVTVDVARFFAEASLGRRPPKDGPDYYSGGDDVCVKLACAGMRYLMPDWQTETLAATKADPGKIKVEYLDAKAAELKVWEWFDRAKTPGEILGRAIIIHAAAMWAVENVVAQSDRAMASHRNQGPRITVPQQAGVLLEKISRPHVPTSVRRLVKAMRGDCDV